jgi:hypothetical protein
MDHEAVSQHVYAADNANVLGGVERDADVSKWALLRYRVGNRTLSPDHEYDWSDPDMRGAWHHPEGVSPSEIEYWTGKAWKPLSESKTDGAEVFTPAPSVSGGSYGSPLQALGARKQPPINANAARIDVDPITGGDPKKLRDIVLDLGKALGRKIQTGKTGGAGGTYYPGTTRTVVRFSGDLDTTAHEIAHGLDDAFGIVGQWAKPRVRSPYDPELIPQFSQYGSVTKSGPRSRLAYQRAEGVAEWVRAWVVNPKAAEAAAPKFAAFFKGAVDDETLKLLGDFSEDVRTWAGLPASQQILTNVRMVEEKASPTARLMRAIRGEGYDGFEVNTLDRLQTAIQDRLKPFTKAVEWVRGERMLGPVLPEGDPVLLARLFNGVGGKVVDVLDNGMIDARGKRVTPGGLTWLIEPLDTSSGEALDKDMADAVSLMVAERILEVGQRPGVNPERVAGVGAGLFSDQSVAADAIAELKADPKRYARLQEAASRYRQWADSLLDYMEQKGRMSAKQVAQIKADNRSYVSFRRVKTPHGEDIEAIPLAPPPSWAKRSGRAKLGTVRTPVQKLKGGTRELDNPYRSLIDQTGEVIAETDRNAVMQAFRDLFDNPRAMYQGAPERLATVGAQVKSGDENAIRIFVNGKAEYWQYQSDLHAAIKGFGEAQNNSLAWNVATLLPKVMRGSIVNSPDFAVRNFIRDAIDRPFKSRAGSMPWDSARKLNKGEVSNFRLAGGDNAGHYIATRPGYNAALRDAMDKLAKDRKSVVIAAPRHVWHAYKHALESSELRGRMAEYHRAYEKGVKELGYDEFNAMLYAAGEARDLLDFAVAGNLVADLNRVIPFLNADVQGKARLIQAARENPRRFLGLYMALAASSIAVLLWHKAQGDDTLDEYRQLPAYKRDLFWNFKVGPDAWLHIPKGFEIAVFASIAERAVDGMLGNPDPWRGMLFDPNAPLPILSGTMATSLLKLDEGMLLGPARPLAEPLTNYDTFRQRSIVPDFENDQPLGDRLGAQDATAIGHAGTSITGAIGRLFGAEGGVDPRKIDYFVGNEFGGAGKTALMAADAAAGKAPTWTQAANRGVGVFGASPASESPAVQDTERAADRAGMTKSPLQPEKDSVRGAQTATERDAAKRSLRTAAISDQVREAIAAAKARRGILDDMAPRGRDTESRQARGRASGLLTGEVKAAIKYRKEQAGKVSTVESAGETARLKEQLVQVMTDRVASRYPADQRERVEKSVRQEVLGSTQGANAEMLRKVLEGAQQNTK